MKYPYYPVPDKFEPSQASLQLWLNTRKSKTPSGGGLFETEKFAIDRTWVIIALALEIITFILTIWGGVRKHNTTFLFLACFGAITFLVLDYIGVMQHHKTIDIKNDARSKMNYEKNPVTINYYKNISEQRFSKFQVLGFICFVVSAILKIIALFTLLVFLRKLTYAFIALYIIVVFIHNNHTGYWFFARKTNNKFKEEFSKYQLDTVAGRNSMFEAKNHTLSFKSLSKQNDVNDLLNNRLSLKYINQSVDNNNQPIYIYTLNCLGCIWDKDVVVVYNKFPDSVFQKDLYEALVILQHQQLGQVVMA